MLGLSAAHRVAVSNAWIPGASQYDALQGALRDETWRPDNESPGKQPPVLNIAAIDNAAKFKLIKLPYKPNPPYTGPVNPTWEANKRSLMTKRPL